MVLPCFVVCAFELFELALDGGQLGLSLMLDSCQSLAHYKTPLRTRKSDSCHEAREFDRDFLTPGIRVACVTRSARGCCAVDQFGSHKKGLHKHA